MMTAPSRKALMRTIFSRFSNPLSLFVVSPSARRVHHGVNSKHYGIAAAAGCSCDLRYSQLTTFSTKSNGT